MGGYNGGKSLKERFDMKWDADENGCWNWRFRMARCKEPRAGTFSLNGHVMIAYRASYIIHVGPIPEGVLICHSCDNGLCVNPEHLWIGTVGDNNRDAIAKGRRLNTLQKGESHTFSKLTQEKVRYFRAEMKDAKWGTLSRLSRELDVDKSTLQDVLRGRTWKHVSD